jgi:hypothetical protein
MCGRHLINVSWAELKGKVRMENFHCHSDDDVGTEKNSWKDDCAWLSELNPERGWGGLRKAFFCFGHFCISKQIYNVTLLQCFKETLLGQMLQDLVGTNKRPKPTRRCGPISVLSSLQECPLEELWRRADCHLELWLGGSRPSQGVATRQQDFQRGQARPSFWTRKERKESNKGQNMEGCVGGQCLREEEEEPGKGGENLYAQV